jgi:hypothetical protein
MRCIMHCIPPNGIAGCEATAVSLHRRLPTPVPLGSGGRLHLGPVLCREGLTPNREGARRLALGLNALSISDSTADCDPLGPGEASVLGALVEVADGSSRLRLTEALEARRVQRSVTDFAL